MLGENHSIVSSPIVLDKSRKYACSDICPCTLFLPRRKQLFLKVVSFEEHMISKDKYLSIFSAKWRLLCLYNNYSMSPSWIWIDKITNERVARVGYYHFISNKGEWNNCFSKFSNQVLPPIFIYTILQSVWMKQQLPVTLAPTPAIPWLLHNKKLNESDSYANDNLSSTCGKNQARII